MDSRMGDRMCESTCDQDSSGRHRSLSGSLPPTGSLPHGDWRAQLCRPRAVLTDVLICCLKDDFCSALLCEHLFLFRAAEAFQRAAARPHGLSGTTCLHAVSAGGFLAGGRAGTRSSSDTGHPLRKAGSLPRCTFLDRRGLTHPQDTRSRERPTHVGWLPGFAAATAHRGLGLTRLARSRLGRSGGSGPTGPLQGDRSPRLVQSQAAAPPPPRA